MKNIRSIFISVFLILSVSTGVTRAEDKTITLTDPAKIADVMTLNDVLRKASEKVTACVDKGVGTPEKCYCMFPNEVSNIKNTFDAVLKKNPEWRDQIVTWWDAQGKMSRVMSFRGLRTQLEAKCK